MENITSTFPKFVLVEQVSLVTRTHGAMLTVTKIQLPVTGVWRVVSYYHLHHLTEEYGQFYIWMETGVYSICIRMESGAMKVYSSRVHTFSKFFLSNFALCFPILVYLLQINVCCCKNCSKYTYDTAVRLRFTLFC